MAMQDYEELDEDDFYGQDFGKDGVVSLWTGMADPADSDPKLDVLQDLCGVGYYSLDNQEVIVRDAPTDILELVADLSYEGSFAKKVAKAPGVAGEKARWLVAQYDFAYDPKRVKRKPADDPRFLGFFKYIADDKYTSANFGRA